MHCTRCHRWSNWPQSNHLRSISLQEYNVYVDRSQPALLSVAASTPSSTLQVIKPHTSRDLQFLIVVPLLNSSDHDFVSSPAITTPAGCILWNHYQYHQQLNGTSNWPPHLLAIVTLTRVFCYNYQHHTSKCTRVYTVYPKFCIAIQIVATKVNGCNQNSLSCTNLVD